MSLRPLSLFLFFLFSLSACTTPSWMGAEKPTAQKKQQITVRATPQPQPATTSHPTPAPVAAAPLENAPLSMHSYSYSTHGTTAAPKVALLLPLSGKNASLGQAMQNAAQMVLFDLASENFELIAKDTGTTPDSAALAARAALAEGAQLIIGPVFATDVATVKPVLRDTSVSMLALSSDSSLADPHSFVMGFAPASFVQRIISYAAHRGVTRFAALLPSGAYGKLLHDSFAQSVAAAQGQIVAEETYGSALEIERAVRALAAQKDRIDGLLIPAGDRELRLIAAALTAVGFDKTKTKLLGTGLWDDPTLGKTDFLVGGWFAASDPDARDSFTKSYVQNYGQKPTRLATLAYDATALAAVLVRQGQRFDSESLTNANGFAGTDGTFRLTSRGFVDRMLAVLEVSEGGNKMIDPAPSTFSGR